MRTRTPEYCEAPSPNSSLTSPTSSPPGQYNTGPGMSECYDCTPGKLSNDERTWCGDCSAGEYVYNDESCELCPTGRYAPSALEDECLECSAGFYTGRQNASTTCSSCGEYSATPPLRQHHRPLTRHSATPPPHHPAHPPRTPPRRQSTNPTHQPATSRPSLAASVTFHPHFQTVASGQPKTRVLARVVVRVPTAEAPRPHAPTAMQANIRTRGLRAARAAAAARTRSPARATARRAAAVRTRPRERLRASRAMAARTRTRRAARAPNATAARGRTRARPRAPSAWRAGRRGLGLARAWHAMVATIQSR